LTKRRRGAFFLLEFPMIEKKIDGIAFGAGRWPPVENLPTLVFIHGSGGSRVLWQPQVEGLAHRVNTVAVDLPGHGASDGDGRDRVEDYARDLAAFVQAAALPRPVPCGLSIGGAIVLQLILDRAELFPAAILCCTGARLRVRPAILEDIVNDYDHFARDLDLMCAESTDRRRLDPIVEATLHCRPAVTLNDYKACDRFDVMDRLSEIFRPVMVVSGAEDKLTPPKYADYLEKQIFHVQRVHIAAAGHLLPLEQPEALNAAIGDFLHGLGWIEA
jgi:pimeloyl-ACP methyl ester carboxylesterase